MKRSEFDELWVSDDPEDRRRLQMAAANDPEVAGWIEWEEQLDRMTREIRPSAPLGSLEQFQTAVRRDRNRRRILHLVSATAAAAAIILTIFLWRPDAGGPTTPTETASPGLLSEVQLVESDARQHELDDEHTALREQIRKPVTTALSPLQEEIRHLDGAIAELREVLAANRKHEHLRSRLEDLAQRRNLLLERLAKEVGP